MSVLVKGMEMPKNCCECKIACVPYFSLDGLLEKFSTTDSVRSDCPLVEVPQHGRLIDADSLNKNLKEMSEIEWNKGVSCSWAEAFDGVTEVVDFEPTLIEAEEER